MACAECLLRSKAHPKSGIARVPSRRGAGRGGSEWGYKGRFPAVGWRRDGRWRRCSGGALHWKRAPPGPPEAPTPLTNCPPTEARQVGAHQGTAGLFVHVAGLRLCRLVTVPLVKCMFVFVCPQFRAFSGWPSGGRDVARSARGFTWDCDSLVPSLT